MANNPSFSFYVNDFEGGTRHMTDEELGCYVRLLLAQFNRDGILPSDEKFLSRFCTSFGTSWSIVKEKFEYVGEGKIQNKRLKKEMSKRERFIDKQEDNGRKGGRPPSEESKVKKPKENPNETQTKYKVKPKIIPDDNPDDTHTETQKKPLGNGYGYGIGDGNRNFGKSENLFFGEVPTDLLEMTVNLEPTAKAGQWQDYVQAEIEKLGYDVDREVPVAYGEGESGRIDLIATKDQIHIAIELDYRTPRKKSIAKVKTYPIGMVLLRDPKIIEVEQGVKHSRVVMPFNCKFSDAWVEWKRYKLEQHHFVYKSDGSEQAALHEITNISKDEDAAIAIIHQSMAMGWKGLFPLKNKENGTSRTNGSAGTFRESIQAEFKKRYGGGEQGGD